MPSKKKKYNARFPSGRIKKIMQTDEEVGKVAQAVPVIISRTLELFVESLLRKAMQITSARNAKTLTPSHMKQCILSESRFDFLKDLVKSLPDATTGDSEEGPLPINLSVQSSINHSTKSENTRFPGNSLRSYTRQSSSTSVQQLQSGQLGNGTNANFYMENVEACASYSPDGPVLLPTCSKVEPASASSDEEYEETLVDYKTTPSSECVLPSSCVTVDEDYDT